MKIKCITCSANFDTIDGVRRHEYTAQCAFQCLHDKAWRGFASLEAIIQHIEHSARHQTSASNAVVSCPTRWSSIPRARYTTVLNALKAASHPRHVLSRYGYSSTESKRKSSYSLAPLPELGTRKSAAVAVDCEMVQTVHNFHELARVTVVDFLTCKVIIDMLVLPGDSVADWRTSITGITAQTMIQAYKEGRVLHGWRQAQQELFKSIDQDTIMIGHALQHDLKALHIHHAQVVDSAIVTSLAVGCGNRRWGLKALCEELLNKPIRQSVVGTHDSIEDAFAAREVVLYCDSHQQDLQIWADMQRTVRVSRSTAVNSKGKTKANGNARSIRSGAKSGQQRFGNMRSMRDDNDDDWYDANDILLQDFGVDYCTGYIDVRHIMSNSGASPWSWWDDG